MLGIALYLLPSKSPIIVVLLLLLSLAMLIHIAWNFWWIENSRSRQIVAVIVLSVAVIAFGYYVWPSNPVGAVVASPEPSLLVEWFTRCVAYLRGLPWRWIAPSVVLGALIAALVLWRLRLICFEKRLHQLKESDRDRIKDLVRICVISYQPETQLGEPPYIDFVFRVFNNSLYEILISDSVIGSITYGHQVEFKETAKMKSAPPERRCGIRWYCDFTVRQWLISTEVEHISRSSDLYFWFEHLTIMFQGTERSPEIKATRLNTDHFVKKEKGHWFAYDQLQYFLAYTGEQWAEVALGSKKSEMEIAILTTERDELKSKVDDQSARILRFETTENQTPLNDDTEDAG